MRSSELRRRDVLVAASAGSLSLAGCTEGEWLSDEESSVQHGYGTAYGQGYGRGAE
ncbi:hypothetical protein [Haloterrigena alkaliphila]|uniref:Uncharacterized protein n=1 Tax=Haloterrigena alkaliphila TaxID=2816475 RepID=A0A8A2VJ57_9EURY|nr:hypothetical protein [Haloterrigena alkaliphila]QSX00363.1 hypothetical protein J0X25_05190 [Haloterrigena alkaliphila]